MFKVKNILIAILLAASLSSCITKDIPGEWIAAQQSQMEADRARVLQLETEVAPVVAEDRILTRLNDMLDSWKNELNARQLKLDEAKK